MLGLDQVQPSPGERLRAIGDEQRPAISTDFIDENAASIATIWAPSTSDCGRNQHSSRRPRERRNRNLSKHLSSYLSTEQEKCSKYGLSGPQETFLSEGVINHLKTFGQTHWEDLLRMQIGICSSEAVATLRDIVITLRDSRRSHLPSPFRQYSAAQRFSIIENLMSRVEHLTLLKRCHVLKLWEDVCAPSFDESRWISIDMALVNRTDRVKRAGNPHNYASSECTKKLLSEIFPAVTAGSPNYTNIYQKVKRLEKLGRRLHLLKVPFGEGILGLIQCTDSATHISSQFNITDQMYVPQANYREAY